MLVGGYGGEEGGIEEGLSMRLFGRKIIYMDNPTHIYVWRSSYVFKEQER